MTSTTTQGILQIESVVLPLRRRYMRWLLLLCCITAGMLPQKKAKAVTVTIGAGTSSYVMYEGLGYTYNRFQHSENFYTAAEIGTAGMISGLKFRKSSGGTSTILDSVWIFMKESTVKDATSTASLSGYTLVYRGSFPNTSYSGWMGVTLTTPFSYTGAGNLGIIVRRKNSSTTSYDYAYYYYHNSPNYTGYYYNSYDYWSGTPETAYQYTQTNARPDLSLDIDPFPACTGTPTAGAAVASTTSACSGEAVTFMLKGSSSSSSITYNWDTSSSASGPFVLAATTTDALGKWLYTPPSGRTLYYQCRLTCSAGGTTVTSTSVSVAVGPEAVLPYKQDFESVTAGTNAPCAATIPGFDASTSFTGYDANWRTFSSPYTGYGGSNHTPGGSNYLWAGYLVGYGGSPVGYWFTPGLYMSTGKVYRFSYWYRATDYVASAGTPVTFGMYYGTSRTPSALTAVKSDINTTSNTYTLNEADFSVPSNGYYYGAIKMNNPSYVWGYYGYGVFDDISISELQPCNTAPTGALAKGGKAAASPNVLCNLPGTTLLSLTGTPPYTGLALSWEVASGTPVTFSTITGATTATYSHTITSGGIYYFRCKVSCTASGVVGYSDTVKVMTVPLNPPYVEDFETAPVPNNLPCASYYGGWSSPGYYLTTANSGAGTGVENHTTGGSKLLLAGGNLGIAFGYDCYWFSPGIALTSGKAYDVSFWYKSASSYSSYDAYTYNFGIGYGSSQSPTSMISLGDTIAAHTDMKSWKRFSRGFIATSTATQYIGIKLNSNSYMSNGLNIDDIGVTQLPPCSARPSAGKAVASPSMVCSTGSTTISLRGTSAASDLSFQWESSATGAGGSWSAISGATSPAYTTPTLTATTYYRCIVKCGLIAAPNTDSTPAVRVIVGPIPPPYIEDFESATAGVNQPCASYTTGWESGTGTSYYGYWGLKDKPGTSYSNVRNHTAGGNKYLSAGMYLSSSYLSTTDANMQYWFSPPLALTADMAYKCNYWYVTSGDSWLPSTTFGLYFGTSQSASAMVAMRPDLLGETNTSYKEIVGSFTAPATGTYYLGVKVNSQYAYYGVAIDDIGVQELPLCAAKPVAGVISGTPTMICSSGTAVLGLSGTSMASKLKFQWLESTAGATGPWSAVSTGSGGTTSVYTTPTLSATRWYRCVVTCPLAAAPNADTSAVYTMNVGAIIPPYRENFESVSPGSNVPCAGSTYWSATSYWYTASGAVNTWGYTDLVNHTTGGSKFLVGGPGLGTYTGGREFWFTPAIRLNAGATYEFSYWYLTTGYPYNPLTLGTYVGTGQSASAMTTTLSADFTPSNSVYQKMECSYTAPSTGNYYFGIYVRGDYFYGMAIDDIGIDQLPPCSGKPASAGIASLSPSMLCVPGTVTLTTKGVSKVANLTYQWYACDAAGNLIGAPISGVLTTPTFTTGTLSTTTWFRCVVSCALGGPTDTTYSSVVKADVGAVTPPYIETFEGGTVNVNMPCASYTGYWWSSSATWNIQGSSVSSGGGSSLDNHTPGGSKYLIGGTYIGFPSYTGSSAEYWFTPAIRFTAGKLYQLSYWYATDGVYYGTPTNYNLATFMGTSQTAAAMTTAIGSPMVGINNTSYKMFKNQFTAPGTGNYYIGFRKGQTVYGMGVSIDDIGLQEVPPCSAPVVAGTVTADPMHICSAGGSATLDLAGSTLATGLTYQWFSAPAEAGPYTAAGGGLPFATAALSANTWFKAVITCTASGATDTTAAFRMGVGGLDLPYSEDFEALPVGGVPLCSDATKWGPDVYNGWYVNGSTLSGAYRNNTPGGKKYLIAGYYLGSPSSTSEDNYWFSPGFNLRGGYKYQLSFYYLGAAPGYTLSKMGVFYGASQSIGAMTNVIRSYRTVTNTSYELVDTTFSPSKAGVYYIGFKKSGANPTTSYSAYGVAFDDINLNYAPCDGMPEAGIINGSVASGTGLCKGSRVQLTDVGATIGLVPGIKYQWQRKGVSAAPSVAWNAIEGATDTVLSGDSLIGYQYRLAVVCGNTLDTAYTVPYQLPQLPPHPAVVISPSVSPVTYCLGDTVHFTATSFAGGVYDWMLDSASIPGWKFNDLGATEPGNYIVKVSSALSPCPAYSNAVKLEANDPGYKVDITLPSDSILCMGETVVLTAAASKGGVTYQWRKNNIDIPGETGTTYLVTSGGAYRVVVSDGISGCPAVSRNIMFVVKPNPPAVITIPGGTLTACEDVGVLLYANTGGYSYQWSRSGSPVFGWTDSAVLVNSPGVYSVKVRNADGCVSISSDVTVAILPSPVPVISRSGVFPYITLSASPTTFFKYTWMRHGIGGKVAEGTGNPFSYVMKKGVYTVIAEDANGCKGESGPLSLMDEELGVGNVSMSDIRVFPNPTQARVIIESPVAVTVTVKDAAGKTVIGQAVVKEIDLGKFADGIYLFELRDVKTGELLKQQRVNKLTK